MMQHSGLLIEFVKVKNLRELCAVVKRFDEVQNLLDSGGFLEELDSLAIKGFGLFLDVLFFAEIVQFTVFGNQPALAQVLCGQIYSKLTSSI